MTRGHCFEVASCHLVFDRKRDNFVCFALKATAQEPIVLKIRRRWSWVDWKMIQRLPPKAGETPTHRVSSESPSLFFARWLKSKSWAIVPPQRKCLSLVQGVPVFLVGARFCGSRFSTQVESCQFPCPPTSPMPTHAHAFPFSYAKHTLMRELNDAFRFHLRVAHFPLLCSTSSITQFCLKFDSGNTFCLPHVRITSAEFGLFLVFKVPHMPDILFYLNSFTSFPCCNWHWVSLIIGRLQNVSCK